MAQSEDLRRSSLLWRQRDVLSRSDFFVKADVGCLETYRQNIRAITLLPNAIARIDYSDCISIQNKKARFNEDNFGHCLNVYDLGLIVLWDDHF